MRYFEKKRLWNRLADEIDHYLSRFGLRLIHRRWMPRGIDAFLYSGALRRARSLSDGAPIIFDIGANVGQTAHSFRGTVPDSLIYSFELVPSTFVILQKELGDLYGHFCHNYGLSDRRGKLEIEVGKCSLRNRIGEGGAFSETHEYVKVEVRTLDEVVEELQIPYIAILKSDTEGHELQVLRGARKILQEGRVGSLLIETTFDGLSDIHTPLPALTEFLSPLGYHLTGVCDLSFRKNGKMKFCNAIFCHSSLV